MSVGVGDRAPDFTLPGTGGTTVSLSDLLGKPIVLVFYPGDDSAVCTKQLNAYNEGLDQFHQLDTQIVGVSARISRARRRSLPSTASSSRCWPTSTSKWRPPTARSGRSGSRGRSVFIIDKDGIIRYAHRAIAGLTYRPVSELLEELERLA